MSLNILKQQYKQPRVLTVGRYVVILLKLEIQVYWLAFMFGVVRAHFRAGRQIKSLWLIGLLQLAVTWYKIRHAGEQAYYYSRTGTSKTKKIQI